MLIIKKTAYDNGAYPNLKTTGVHIPDGWAIVPEGMELPSTFPWVVATFKGNEVTSLTANQEAYDKAMTDIPPEKPTEDNEETTTAEMAEAIKAGVNAI